MKQLESSFSEFYVQGDSSKMGQTLRLKPRFNTVPLHFFFKLLCLSVVQVNYCTGDHSNLKKSWEGTVLKQGFNLNVCPILKESPCKHHTFDYGHIFLKTFQSYSTNLEFIQLSIDFLFLCTLDPQNFVNKIPQSQLSSLNWLVELFMLDFLLA